MTETWTALAVPRRTVFGRGSRHKIVGALGAVSGPVLLVHGRSARWAEALAGTLQAQGAAVLTAASDGEPSLPVLECHLKDLREAGIGAVVAIGGGSAIDLGKALAALLPARGEVLDYLEVVGRGQPLDLAPLPLIAVPTTAGTGAEATRNAVIDVPAHRRKVSLRDPRMIPGLAVLDADLTDEMPWPVTLMTGMDAITQLIEPYLSKRATPATDFICQSAIEPAMRVLIRLSEGPSPEARDTLLFAAHLSGIALANAGLGAVHGLAGVIGGQSGAPHGAICGALLPGVLEVNRNACARLGRDTGRFDEVDRMIARAFGRRGASAPALLRDFVAGYDLAEVAKLSGDMLAFGEVAEQAKSSSSMKANPVELTTGELLEVLSLAGNTG